MLGGEEWAVLDVCWGSGSAGRLECRFGRFDAGNSGFFGWGNCSWAGCASRVGSCASSRGSAGSGSSDSEPPRWSRCQTSNSSH